MFTGTYAPLFQILNSKTLRTKHVAKAQDWVIEESSIKRPWDALGLLLQLLPESLFLAYRDTSSGQLLGVGC